MYAVIQEIHLKKPNTCGAYQEYEITHTETTINGKMRRHYDYYPKDDAGRFGRPHMEAYKVSVHRSYRESSAVKKQQCAVATIGYYDLADDGFVWDILEKGLERAAMVLGAPFETITDLVYGKIGPLQERIKAEFHASDEYKAEQTHKKILEHHAKAKAKFVKKYSAAGVTEYDYGCIYDVMGELREPTLLKEIVDRYETSRSYSDYFHGNYSYSGGYSGGGYCADECSTYTQDELAMLKNFYKALSMKFHPDMNQDADTTREMQLLNKLKDSWGI